MFFESKLLKIGDETAMILTPEMLASLGANAGDVIQVVHESEGSLRIFAKNGMLALSLDAGEATMNENDDLLRGLA
jgi:hypothetical protein